MIARSISVIKKESKYLLLKKVDTAKTFPGSWDFPGGKDDPGETPEESVVRETMEETSFEIDPGKEVMTKKYHDENFDLLFRYFTPKIISGELKLSEEHSDFAWVSEDELENYYLHPAVKLFFEN